MDPALERSFRGHKGAITSVAFNPNMEQLVSGSADGSLMVWHFRPQLRPYKFLGHKVSWHAVLACCPCCTPQPLQVRAHSMFFGRGLCWMLPSQARAVALRPPPETIPCAFGNQPCT